MKKENTFVDKENSLAVLFDEEAQGDNAMYQTPQWNDNFGNALIFDLAPGESVEWRQDFSLPRIVAAPPMRAETAQDNYEVKDAINGLMTVHITKYPTISSTSDNYYELTFASPFVINEAYLVSSFPWPDNAVLSLRSLEDDKWLNVLQDRLAGKQEVPLNYKLFFLGEREQIISRDQMVAHSGYGFRVPMPFQSFGEDRAFQYGLSKPYYALYEDNKEMMRTNNFSDVFEKGGGYYRTQDNLLYFSSSDQRDPRAYHQYVVKGEEYSVFWSPFGQYSISMRVSGVTDEFIHELKLKSLSQFNKNNFPLEARNLRLQNALSKDSKLQIDIEGKNLYKKLLKEFRDKFLK